MRSPRTPPPVHRLAVLVGALLLATAACVSASAPDRAPVAAPADRIASVCDHQPAGPATPPVGAVTVDAAVDGDLSTKTDANPQGTTFWLTPGDHTLGTNEYDQVQPKDGNKYIGGPGAILDGRGMNRYAFVAKAENVSISYLTVRGFAPPANEGVVNHDSGAGWLIEHSTIERNRGAGLMAGARQIVRHNCIRDNGQYGINAFQDGNGIVGLVVENNEISGNNTEDWESKIEGCGCTGGIKFWAVNGADIRNNWVHDNHGAGIWADTNNNDFLIEGNVIAHNDGSAVMLETSYNTIIRNNTIRDNNWVSGQEFARRGDTFPAAAIYISESGGEPRLRARTDKIEITGNTLTNNWSGITLWENADRFCNSPSNTSTGYCTLVVSDINRCTQPAIASPPLFNDCRWRTQRVDVHHNRFSVRPAEFGCRANCTVMAVLSIVGTSPTWSPYKGDVIQKLITNGQDNRWHDNTYDGPWTFMALDTGTYISADAWQNSPWAQDSGSSFSP